MKSTIENVNTSIVLRKKAQLKDEAGKFPVRLQLSHNRKQHFLAFSKERYTEKEFNDIINPKSKNEKKIIREHFNEILKRADIIIEKMDLFNYDEFKVEFFGKRGNSISLQDYFEQKATELDVENKISTAILYRATINSLELFDKKISFQKLTPKYLKEYEKWMVSDLQGKSYTTVGVYMRNLKHIINRAIKDKINIDYPFGTDKDKYQIPVSNNIKKALSLNDIKKLVTYESDIEQEMQALRYWLFSYLCSGMNMVDIANLKFRNIQGGSLRFIRQKTKDTTKVKNEIDIYLTPEALQIIEILGNGEKEPNNYIFPILKQEMTEQEKYDRVKQHIKNTNKYINRIAGKVGIEARITTYSARHSYSTVLKRSGASVEFIREQLGHQTTKVTQNYLDSFEDEQKAKMANNLLKFD